eukprot:m.190625 g.190625  ORF g.190625 m.190625 type:complete len:1158 (-) comp16947_c0_seq1:144-3617(-)
MADLLSPKNQCGQTLLRLASRGNAIIAELLRLADNVPEPFLLARRQDQERYKALILDFAYFKRADYYNRQIDSSTALQDLDEQLRETHIEILTRFYKAFESVYKYISDFTNFLDDVEEGVYIYQTMDNILASKHGKQLMTEIVYLYGVMLLSVDMKLPGLVRERLIVAYQRYCTSESDLANVESVIKLFRSTEYSHQAGAKRPANYPEAYFKRIELPSAFIQMLIGRLRTDDIYDQMSIYPEPEHRSTALSTQAAMLYVILFFDPKTLQTEQAKMREIVDKHFPDNWMINLYMGVTVNLAEAWEPYKAARKALDNSLEAGNIQTEARRHISLVPELQAKLDNLLKEGVLCEEYVLDNTAKLMRLMRKINVTLRWLMLHSYSDPRLAMHKRVGLLREEVAKQGYNAKAVFNLLLSTAQYEFTLKEMFQGLLARKESKWDGLKTEASNRMSELSDVFGGATPLTRVEVNEKLRDWFKNMGTQIGGLDYSDSTAAGRKIVQMHQALEEVQSFHQVESSLQVRQFLKETQGSLQQMIRTINIKEEVLFNISEVADLSYAWQTIDNYTAFMQAGIKADPTLVIKLRATFLKLASAMELPLLRIQQVESPDLMSVSQFYSSELVAYVRRVLQIIPESMFEILDRVIAIRTQTLKEVPTRLEKDELKVYAQLDTRYLISELTYQISVFTEGILMMKSTLVGVIKVDPKQLLEDGIRRELVGKVAPALDQVLVFEAAKGKPVDLHHRLRVLQTKMAGFRRSFEYIQDYVDMYGLKIWQEEVSRIVNYNVEQECNTFLRLQVTDNQSLYQSKAIPIPRFATRDGRSSNFVGRLARELMRLTAPATTVYVDSQRAWYDTKTKQEVVNKDTFHLLRTALNTFGLAGLDKLFSFMIVNELQTLEKRYTAIFKRAGKLFESVEAQLRPYESPPASTQPYNEAVAKLAKENATLSTSIIKVGHLQLLRRMIATELNMAAKLDGKLLLGAVSALSDGLLAEIEDHYLDPSKPFPGGDSLVVAELSAYTEAVGYSDPLQKIYLTTSKLDHVSTAMFLLTLSQLQGLSYSKSIGTITAAKPTNPVDGPAFITGMVTVMKQFHASHSLSYHSMLSQYIRTTLLKFDPKTNRLPQEALLALAYLDEMATFSKAARRTLHNHVPPYVVDEFRKQVTT